MPKEYLAGVYRDELTVTLGRKRVQYGEKGSIEDIYDEESFTTFYLGELGCVDSNEVMDILNLNLRSLAHRVE